MFVVFDGFSRFISVCLNILLYVYVGCVIFIVFFVLDVYVWFV